MMKTIEKLKELDDIKTADELLEFLKSNYPESKGWEVCPEKLYGKILDLDISRKIEPDIYLEQTCDKIIIHAFEYKKCLVYFPLWGGN